MRFFLVITIYSKFQKGLIKNFTLLFTVQKENSKIIHLKKSGFDKISCSDKFSICLNQLGVHNIEKD